MALGPATPAPGRVALQSAMRNLHPGVTPFSQPTLGAEPPGTAVETIEAYPAGTCWHLVTHGLSELGAKRSTDPAVSGWGFELTMRVPREPGRDLPPSWALNLLKVVGDSVYRTGQPLAEGSRLDIGAPVTGRLLSRLVALALAPDPELGPISTDNGRVEFLAVVGVTREEYQRMLDTSTEAVLDGLRAADPLLLTDPDR